MIRINLIIQFKIKSKIFFLIYIKLIIILICIGILLNEKKKLSLKILKRNELNILGNLLINISSINYSFSYLFNMVKIEYSFSFYEENNNLIVPSDLTYYYSLHIFCQAFDITNNITIKTIANVLKNKYYSCIEYFNINGKMNIGIAIYKIVKYYEYYSFNLFTNDLINYNDYSFKLDDEYNPFIILNNYFQLEKDINDSENKTNILNENLLLKRAYLAFPNFLVKSNYAKIEKIWYYKNLYNQYFCYCKYSKNNRCIYRNISKKCKYNIYLNIIDKNKNILKKTDYLFADFRSPNKAPCEAYLLFKEMIKLNYNAHFMTEREDIYKKYNNSKYLKYNIPVIYDSNMIDGEFLEKYLKIFLKLKATISGAKIYSINNLFYIIDYITYISLGHGISYLKDFLYIGYYSCKIYNKIILPFSKIIISNAMKYGWKYNNIIKFGLPRWDIFFENENHLNHIQKDTTIRNHSIFVMFTWRDLKKNKSISKYYFTNIFKLINNKMLRKIIKQNNITLFFSLHHNMIEYKYLFKENKYIQYINQEKILECLKNSDLIITDFSSIVFDMIVRQKPFIIYIPDSKDKALNSLYNSNYFDIINNLKNNKIYFENKYFNLNETINKIIYYIKNNFNLEEKIKLFYDSFHLKGGKNIINIINYLNNLNNDINI